MSTDDRKAFPPTSDADRVALQADISEAEEADRNEGRRAIAAGLVFLMGLTIPAMIFDWPEVTRYGPLLWIIGIPALIYCIISQRAERERLTRKVKRWEDRMRCEGKMK